ncbi:hypothetical protein JRQ81_012238 [Phrynocephalus forsythii]|uniref:Ig-like domain-containing protein n=1 Tax=Phrynocephalus forsythii TaxID=171643 RepID=A0A9Q1AQA8_9SAUR|nr:hypothetical protein JRQ81_012238 [Phrynocephalus forsythii]
MVFYHKRQIETPVGVKCFNTHGMDAGDRKVSPAAVRHEKDGKLRDGRHYAEKTGNSPDFYRRHSCRANVWSIVGIVLLVLSVPFLVAAGIVFFRKRPEGKVTRQAGFDDTESLVCQAYGFYPKEIEVTWRKDGEVLHEDTFHRNTAPYPDGTYHAWLSISIDPKDRDQYRCHVEHASLAEPLVLAWEEPASNLGLFAGCVVAIVLIAAVTAGSCIYFKKRQEGYKAPLKSDRGSSSSSRGSDAIIWHP